MKINHFLFPGIIIVLYEMFIIRIYDVLDDHPMWIYGYFILTSAAVSIIGSTLSDRFSRRVFLNISLLFGAVLLILLYFGFEMTAIFLSPLFFSVPTARAALIDQHEHMSVKNLMCFSYVSLFIPWSMYSFFAAKDSNVVFLIFLMITIVASFFYEPHKMVKEKNNRRAIVISKSNKFMNLFYFAMGFIFVEMVYFLIFGILEFSHIQGEIFNFMGTSLALGSFFCLFLKGRHNDLIFLTYIFLLLLTVNSFLAFFLWKHSNIINIFLGETAIVGGVYLPLVTEKVVLILGKKKRGFACGLVEVLVSLASLSALIGFSIFRHKEMVLIFAILILVITACVFQKKSESYSK